MLTTISIIAVICLFVFLACKASSFRRCHGYGRIFKKALKDSVDK